MSRNIFNDNTTDSNTSLGLRLDALKSLSITQDSAVIFRGGNLIEKIQISDFGKSLISVSSLNTLVSALNTGDSSLILGDVSNETNGNLTTNIDGTQISIYDINGLSINNNKIFKTNYIQSESGGIVNFGTINGGAIQPVADNNHDMGAIGSRFRNGYIVNQHSNILYVDEIYEKTNNYSIRLKNDTITNSLYPETTNKHIGIATLPYNKLYTKNIFGSSGLNIYGTTPTSETYGLTLNSHSWGTTLYTKSTTDNHGLYLRSSGNGLIILGSRASGTSPSSETSYMTLDTAKINVFTHILPNVSDDYNLGSGTHKFRTIFLGSGGVNSSDFNLKKDISPLKFNALELINTLKPVQYKFKKNQSNRLHLGFIAQDIGETVLKNYGAFCYKKAHTETIKDDEGNEKVINHPDFYGLRYTELISVLVQSIQDLDKKVVNLEDNNNVVGETFVLQKATLPVVQQSSIGVSNISNSNNELETQVNSLSMRVFNLENKNDTETDDGATTMNELLQTRIHALELQNQKQDQKIKKLTTSLNKLIKQLS